MNSKQLEELRSAHIMHEAIGNNIFRVGRNNRRKSTRGRKTQVINVPKYIPKKGLSKHEQSLAKTMQKLCDDSQLSLSDLFVKNESKWAGKAKQIFHTTQGR